MSPANPSLTVSSISVSLASGLISGIAGKFGAIAIELLIGGLIPDSSHDQTVQAVRAVIKDELTQNDVDVQKADVDGIVGWIQETYLFYKTQGPISPDLNTELNRKIGEAQTAAYALKADRLQYTGIVEFLYAANTHLTLLQEQALLHGLPLRGQSSEISNYIEKYFEHANTVYNKLKHDLEVHERMIYIYEGDSFSPDGPSVTTYNWTDDLTHEGRGFGPNRDGAQTDMDKHINEVITTPRNNLVSLSNTIDRWGEFLKTPTYTEVTYSLSNALVNGVDGKLGVAAFQVIIGSTIPTIDSDVTQAVVDQVSSVKLVQSDFVQFSAEITKITTWISKTYASDMSQGKASLDQLVQYPGGYVFNIQLVAGEMTRPTPWLPGLTLFLYSASIHLLLLQEKAMWQKLPLKGKGTDKDLSYYAGWYAEYASGALSALAKVDVKQREKLYGLESIIRLWRSLNA